MPAPAVTLLTFPGRPFVARLNSLTELQNAKRKDGMSYGRFGAMIGASTVIMHGLMYLNTFQLDHVYYSQTRLWMALIMGATMAILMLFFMWSTYERTRMNVAIVVASVVMFIAALWLVRSQETVDDVSYVKAMTSAPFDCHHDQRPGSYPRRLRKLADKIIEAQVREIGEMKQLISDLERSPTPAGAPDLLSYRKRGAPPPED